MLIQPVRSSFRVKEAPAGPSAFVSPIVEAPVFGSINTQLRADISIHEPKRLKGCLSIQLAIGGSIERKYATDRQPKELT